MKFHARYHLYDIAPSPSEVALGLGRSECSRARHWYKEGGWTFCSVILMLWHGTVGEY